jgi:hypothetical protein
MIASAAPAIPPNSVSVVLFHDARAVHDVVSLGMREYLAPGRAWIVAEVTPESHSGSAMVPGAHVDGDTGQMVASPGTKTVTIKEGTWKAVAGSPTEPDKGGTYSWNEPQQRSRAPQPEDYYSPFVSGGTILCQRVRDTNGIDQFGPVLLLFSDWGQYVGPASEFVRQHPRLFQDNQPAPDVAWLTSLLAGQNELLATLAWRQLIATGKMTSSLARTHLARAPEHLTAVFAFLLLTAPAPANKDRSLMQEIDKIVNTSQELAKLRSIALACFTVALFESGNADAMSQSKQLLTEIRHHLRELGPSIQAGRYLGLIFEKMDIK